MGEGARLVGTDSVKCVDVFCTAAEIPRRFLGIRVVAFPANEISKTFLRVFFRVNNGINFLLRFSVHYNGVILRIRFTFHRRSPFLQITIMGDKVNLQILW